MGSDWLRRLVVGLSVLSAGNLIGRVNLHADEKPKQDQQLDPEVIKGQIPDILITDPTLLHGEPVNAEHRFWIGVASEPAVAAMHAQLPDLPKGAGLVVQQVVADSPAAKAGIQPNDILFAAGEKALAQVADLSAAITAGKDAELPIKLIRGGKTMTITVKPEEQKPSRMKLNDLAPDDKAVRLFVNQLQLDALHPLVLRDLPVTTNGGSLMIKHELPDDMTVDIHREGKKPAKITIKKEDHKWEINEDQLDKLPEDVRHELEPLLGGGPDRIKLNFVQEPQITAAQLPSNEITLDYTAAAGNDADILNRLQKNVEEIDQRLTEMKQTIKELRTAREHKAEKPAK